MKYIITVFFVLLASYVTSQTCIIAKIKGEYIYMGADSKQSAISKSDTTFLEVCKIFTFNKITFATRGTNPYEQKICAEKACIKSNNIEDAIATYAKLLIDTLQKELNSYKLFDVDAYSEIIKQKHSLTTIFCGYLNNKAVLCSVDFYLNDMSKYEATSDFGFGDSTLRACGKLKYISNSLKNHTKWKNIPYEIKKLIKTECKMEPQTVGEPVNIIKITPQGIEWLDNVNCK